MINRRKFLQAGIAAGLATSAPFRLFVRDAYGFSQPYGLMGGLLSDPAAQPKFANLVPDALMPGYKYVADKFGRYRVQIREGLANTGLVDAFGTPLQTPVWGYADQVARDRAGLWPGKTFEVRNVDAGGPPTTEVNWANSLKRTTQHLLPVDTNLHWCYSLHGYNQLSIATDGVPTITHLHGGHSDFQFDGNPEFFYGPDGLIQGPQWAKVPGGFTERFSYDNTVQAGNLWYHDHALGITRLNVYAGLAGFYFVRDAEDTGLPGNTLGLPAWPYEKAYAIQDRMFLPTGQLFYSAYPGDPFYEDFISGEGAILPPGLFPGGGPTALAEFFGDHMLVNGVIWPFEKVEQRPYRLHLLNGTDSRFMMLQLRLVVPGTENFGDADGGPQYSGEPIPFTVIGSDQGLASSASTVTQLLSEPGSRYDIVVDFSGIPFGSRVVMTNLLGDAPYGGEPAGPDDMFPDRRTDRIMAFDVTANADEFLLNVPKEYQAGHTAVAVPAIARGPSVGTATRKRKVALFEGMDEFGRLQPLLGTAEPATDHLGNLINWPADLLYSSVGLTGPMEGSIAWHSPTTENPMLGETEEWEIWNATGDAHPVHLHLVHFEVMDREEILWDSATIDGDRVLDPDGLMAPTPNGDGTYLVVQPTVQHNSIPGDLTTYGTGFKLQNLTLTGVPAAQPDGVVENTPKDMVTALPGQVTRIKATFDKPGRYVWHCHILSHEDHEMMRVLHVGPGA